MSRIVYVNGRYMPYSDAGVHVEDRGFQFADAVYEVCEVRAGAVIDETRHLARLERSLGEIGMAMPMNAGALRHVIRLTIRRNRVVDGTVYLQVSRGTSPREFAFPGESVKPTIVIIARRGNPEKLERQAGQGIGVVSTPDIRWGRCDIKTVMLLPACLAKHAARQQGAKEAWLVGSDGFVTEGASSNAWIVDNEGRLRTRPRSSAILAGITRATVMDECRALGIAFEERAFTVAEALAAREAFLTAASNTVMPVVSIDGVPIGDGRPGPLATALRARFHDYAEAAR